jgi:hypothetical protein
LVANEIAYRLQPLERSPGGLPGERAVVGATHSSWFSFRATFLSTVRNFLCLTNAMLLSPRIGPISFVETRQSAFIFQA